MISYDVFGCFWCRNAYWIVFDLCEHQNRPELCDLDNFELLQGLIWPVRQKNGIWRPGGSIRTYLLKTDECRNFSGQIRPILEKVVRTFSPIFDQISPGLPTYFQGSCVQMVEEEYVWLKVTFCDTSVVAAWKELQIRIVDISL